MSGKFDFRFSTGDKICLSPTSISNNAPEVFQAARITPGKVYTVVKVEVRVSYYDIFIQRDDGVISAVNSSAFILAPLVDREDKILFIKEAFGFSSEEELMGFLK